ncbi:MAG: hypothetical protein AAF710_11905 [Planctomycetota bacterium]
MASAPAEIEVGPETQRDGAWAYDVTVFAAGRVRRHAVTLSFQDYDLWSRGRVGPSRVAHAAVRYWLDQPDAEPLPEAFDCSRLRRHFPDADAELPGRL